MNRLLHLPVLLSLASPMAVHATSLIVVEDRGGVSALPYYQDLAPEPTEQSAQSENIGVRGQGSFPVRSDQLTPGQVFHRSRYTPSVCTFFSR